MPELDRLTWKQTREYLRSNDTCLFPIGCNHAHDHIFVGIDNVGADVIARELSDRTKVLLIPQLNFGWMPQYASYEGTISISQQTMKLIILEVITTLHKWGIKKVVFINGHGGNTGILEDIGTTILEWGMLAPILEWWTLACSLLTPDLNATLAEQGKTRTRGLETAFAMALNMVDMDDIYTQEYKQVFGDKLEIANSPGHGILPFQCVKFRGVPVPMPMKVRELTQEMEQGKTEATTPIGQAIIDITNDFCVDFIEEIKKIDVAEVIAESQDRNI
ncbi:creatininase family protein [Candidatus Bipolaricaulota bacterium]